MLDEALDLLLALWSGEVVNHHGSHFTADQVVFRPVSIQQPRIPVWGAARGGGAVRPVRRAARLDGLFPVQTNLDQLDKMLEVVASDRGSLDGFDVAMLAFPDSRLDAYAALGVTWCMWSPMNAETTADTFAFVDEGPP